MKKPTKSPKPPKPVARRAHAAGPDGPAAGRHRVLLVDDHPMMRAGLGGLINRQPDLQVCGEAGSPAEAIGLLSQASPDLVVTDMTMPGRSGVEFIKDLLALRPELTILVLSMHDEMIHGERVLRAGARGYIMKEAGAENILKAMREVLKGTVYVSPAMSAKLLDGLSGRRPRGSSSPIEKLSDREFEVFQLVGAGRSTREIAQQLSLSPKTVDVHRGHIKDKLDLQDATSLVRYAVRWVETQNTADRG